MRAIAGRSRDGRVWCFPKARSLGDWRDRFHVTEREKGTAFIPPAHTERHELFREVTGEAWRVRCARRLRSP